MTPGGPARGEHKARAEAPLGDIAHLVEAGKRGAVLRVHVQPGALSEGLAGVHGTAVKLRVRAPAVSGKANEALLRLLARELGVPAADVALVGGTTSHDKRVRFDGLSAADLCRRLASALARLAPPATSLPHSWHEVVDPQ